MKLRPFLSFVLSSYLVFLITSCFNVAFAEAEDPEKLRKVRRSYSVRIYPDIVTNLRITNQQKKLKYILLRLDMLVAKLDDEEIVRHYIPQIKDKTILFLNKQTTRNFKTKKRRQSTKAKLLVLINEILFKEIKQKLVTEVLFQKLIVE